MPANPMQRKARNSFFLGVLVMLIITILVAAIIFVVVVKPKLDKKKQEEEIQYAYTYRLKKGMNVESGEEITVSMVEPVEIPVQTTLTDFIPAKTKDKNGDLKDVPFIAGYKSKLDLSEGTILTYSLLYETELTPESLRYTEYNMITMPTTIEVGDYVDVRLKLQNGQDLIVATKKEVQTLYKNTIGFNLTEEEILILNSAIVENYIMPASELYLVKYVEPGMQTAAVYTYVPTAEVTALMNMDSNIVNTAKAELANIYNRVGTDTRGTINTIINGYDNDERRTNIETGIREQIDAAIKAREEYLSEMQGN